MVVSLLRLTALCAATLAGLLWLGSGSVAAAKKPAKTETKATPPTPAEPAPDRVALVSADDPQYTSLAIPRSFKSAPGATQRLLVFRGGLCVRDHGLADTVAKDGRTVEADAFVEQSGTNQRAYVASDGTAAVVVGTRYVSRVDMRRGQTSTANDTITGDTTLTLLDPAHPDGRWRVTLEMMRWAKDVLVLPNDAGVVVTTFLPRYGPADVRILDREGRETIRVPESRAESVRVDASPDGAFVAAEVKFRESPTLPERGVMVFDLAKGSQWTYGWRYGSDDEPLSWSLESRGVLAVKIPGGTRRFGPTGQQL